MIPETKGRGRRYDGARRLFHAAFGGLSRGLNPRPAYSAVFDSAGRFSQRILFERYLIKIT
jgi:hypothetical protein